MLCIALTDTFGTPAFFNSFRKPIPLYTTAEVGKVAVAPSGATTTIESPQSEAETKAPIAAPLGDKGAEHAKKTYAQVYSGIRQDSGDPLYFVKMARDFYDKEGIKDQKTLVFSDSLNIKHCLDYKEAAEEAGFKPVFGVGTFLTSMVPPCLCCYISLLTNDYCRRFRQEIGRPKVEPVEHRD